MKRRANHIGRLRIRAAAILGENFPEWDVYPEDISPATGRWRTDWRMDVYRWELFTRTKTDPKTGRNIPVVVGCWDTLTLFVREAARVGCHLSHDVIYTGPDNGR